MQRKRGELVPVAEVIADLSGTVAPALRRESSAQRHFTQADQVNQLATVSEADADLGFMARMMALCSLPRTNPGNRTQYVRRNGPYTLVMSTNGLHKLPYGNLPRLLLAWVSTEAVRTRSRVLILGPSLSKFMRELGVYSSGGGNAGIKLRNQMKRLFDCTIKLTYNDENVERFVNSPIAARGEFWWNERKPDQPSLWESKIELGWDLFNEIINHPVPLDMNTLKALKRCSLGLDLYMWLTYRTFAMKHSQPLTWRQLYRQFEANPAKASDKQTIKFFRRKVLRELKKIKLAWPELNYSTAPGVLILHPSTPTIAPLKQGQLGR